MDSVSVSVRASAVSLAASGLFVAAFIPWHPSIFTRPVDEVVRGFSAWTAMHAIGVVGVILAFLGAAGLVAAHHGRLGRLGQAGLLVTLVGVVMTAALLAVEATVFPVLATDAPALLSIQGPLLTSWLFIGVGLLAAGWPLGLSLLGLAAARSQVFPRRPGILLAVSGPAFLALEGPFVPVLGVASALLFGGVQIWWAWLLWQRPTEFPGKRPT